MGEKNLIYLDYNKISMRLDAMIEVIRKEEFTAIAVIVRGGLFPAAHLSVRTGLPMFYLRYNRVEQNQISWIGERPVQGKLLLVEDIAGRGRTLLDSRDFLDAEGYDHKALVVWKDTISASTPEFIGFETTNPQESFVVPWEKTVKLNPRDRASNQQDHELEFTGWDMDGIFLEDVPSEIYRAGLQEALAIRDNYPLASIQPSLGDKDVIITGRPSIDKERTLTWLGTHKIHSPLFLRDDGIEHPTPYTSALWKGKKAVEVGCSRYVESDSEQAMFIAANYPQLEVLWWNNGNPITVQASPFLRAI